MRNRVICLLVFTVMSCSTVNVAYDYDKEVDFNNYKTYNYYQDIETGLSEFDTKRLIETLDRHLQAKGFVKSDTPDLFINITSEDYQNNTGSSVGLGVGSTGGNVGGGMSVGIPIGSSKLGRQIIFDFVDENGKGLIWQAVSDSKFYPDATPEQREADFEAIVVKVLEAYPPKTKEK